MSVSRNAEPGTLSEQQQVQQQPAFNFPSAIPIKKRRFPLIQSPSPSPEEKISSKEINESKNEFESKTAENNESKNEQESKISQNNEPKNEPETKVQGEERPSLIDATTTSSPGKSDVSKASASTVKKDISLSNTNLGQANVENIASKPHEANPTVNMNSVADLGNNFDILSNEKSRDPEVPESCLHTQTANVKQEISGVQNTEGTCGPKLSTGSMSVELSLGQKEPAVPFLEHEKDEATCNKPGKSDLSLLSMALRDQQLAGLGENDSTLNEVASQVCTNRSNWDLNTTMDVWEGSTDTDTFAGTLADVGGFGKMDDFQGEKSSLTIAAGAIGLSLDKGERILDVSGYNNSSNATVQQFSHQFKTDDSLSLRLAMPRRELDVRKELFSSSDNSVSINANRSLGLQQVQMSAANVNRPVKSEPVDENSKRDCSVVSSSSNNMVGLLKSCVKTEIVNTQRAETVLQPSFSLDNLIYSGKSMKSEAVHQDNQNKSDDITLRQSVSRTMQHQQNCESSPLPLIPVPFTSQNLCSSSLPVCSESMQIGDSSSLLEHCRELSHSFPDENISRPHDIRNLSAVDHEKYKLAGLGQNTFELDDDEKITEPSEKSEKGCFMSGFGSQGNCDVGNLIEKGENKRNKEDEEYEDGEVREPIQCPHAEKPIAFPEETENCKYSGCDSQNLQPSGGQDISPSDFDSKSSAKEILEETLDSNDDRTALYGENNSLQKALEKVLEVGVDKKRAISGTQDELLEDCPAKEISVDGPANVDCGEGVELEDEDNAKVVKETCSGDENNNSTLSKADASSDGLDPAKDSSNVGNKSRIINLSRASAGTSPCKTTSNPKRLLTPTWSGKDRYSDFDGEAQPRGNRDEFYTGGRTNKFAKDRAQDQDQLHMNPRSSFSNRRRRMSGRFGSLRGDWNPSDHDFASETPYGPSNYHPTRRKQADVEIECNGYDMQQEGTSDRRKPKKDEFPSLRRTSLRRLSPGDGENENFPRFRNTSPHRHSDKFMRHLSDDIINHSYNNLQATHGELDGQQLGRGNRNFSSMQRKGYSRNHSKSPIRSRTRSPGPWSSPQNSRRSPAFYRTGRMRSPDRACFRDEMVPRRHGSPLYGPRHHSNNDPRSGSSNRRGSPERGFLRSGRRADELDSREMIRDCGEYMNGPSNKFNERRRPVRSFRLNYTGDSENFRFNPNEGHGPYRFCSDSDGEFVERGGGRMREREFEGRVKHHHQSLGVSRRIRNVEEHEDGNYRPVERAWHEDGFSDGRVKRRRF